MSDTPLGAWLEQWPGNRRPDEAALAELQRDFSALAPIGTTAMDAQISAERLQRQLDVIERRLDGQPGRILHFPAPARAARVPPPLRRWVAMAAACGLVFGLAAGRLFSPALPSEMARGSSGWPGAARGVQAGQVTMEPAVADERLLGEVDAAIARTLHKEFRVLDELTPAVSTAGGRR